MSQQFPERLFPFDGSDPEYIRLFPFDGSDPEYIHFLEQFIRAQWAGPTDFPIPLGPGIPNDPSPSNDFEIVQYRPSTSRNGSQVSEQAARRWKSELHNFISALPAKKDWGNARQRAGIDTPLKNQLALQLMLGHTNVAASSSVSDDASRPLILPTENGDLVSRGYYYAGYIHQWADNLSFTESVVSFQGLIFVSYCVVMMGSGISKETTNNMMRRYIVRKNDDKTLEAYRRGVVWIHRCIAELLVNGWGYKSWELFLLEKRSLGRFARFAANDARSYKALVQHLGEANLPLHAEAWIPYCIPCIVQSLAGDIIGLDRICDILDYSQEAKAKVMSSSKQFFHSLQSLATS